jgi:hypothetical protein
MNAQSKTDFGFVIYAVVIAALWVCVLNVGGWVSIIFPVLITSSIMIYITSTRLEKEQL